MRIIVWGINYAPEQTGIGPFNTALCEFLSARGHDVEMVTTFPYYPSWRKEPCDRWRLAGTETRGGVRVRRCWHYVPALPSLPKRIVHEGSFVAMSLLRVLGLKRPDVFIVVSPPLLLGAAATMAGWLKRAPYAFHVQDLQPDAALGLEMVKPGLFTRLLYGLEALAYRNAASVSGISQGMLRAFARKGVPERKRLYFPNGVALPDEGDSRTRTSVDFRRKQGFGEDDFLAIYSGNLGVKQGLIGVIEAAEFLRDTPIRLVICGEGSQRAVLEERILDLSLDNVTILPLQPLEDYRAMLQAADVCLVTQSRGSGQAFLPSKLLSILASGKPVLAVADRDSALTAAIEEGRFGVAVQPEDANAFLAAIRDLQGAPERLAAMGEAGREFVAQFEQNRVLEDFATALEKLISDNPPPSPDQEARTDAISRLGT